MTIQVGADPANTLTSAERLASGKGWAPGDLFRDHSGNEWIYVQAGAAIAQNLLVRVLASAHQAVPFTSAGVAGTAGAVKCYAISASASIASGSYGWVMTKGTAGVLVSASATGTYVPTAGQLYALASAAATGRVSQTATSTHFAAIGLAVAATATTSTITSAVPVVFFDGITMTTVEA
jgi:hypothetical protein